MKKYQSLLDEDARVLIQGRVSAEDDKASKLILERVRTFEEVPRELWLQFDDRDAYADREAHLMEELRAVPGNASVVIYLKDVKAMKKPPAGYRVALQEEWLEKFRREYGSENVRVVERALKSF